MHTTASLAVCAALLATSSLLAAKPLDLLAGDDLAKWKMDKEGAWTVTNGELHPSEKPGGYIWTKKTYEDFVLELEFKMSPKCNSGVFIRTDPKNAVQGGFEIQVMDTAANAKMGKHDCGALYDAMAPSSNAAKPAGEWNTMKITCHGPKITVVLNGSTVVDVNIDEWSEGGKNPDGSKNKFKTALKDIPRDNCIGLQYHGHPVWFRNIRVEKL